MTGDSLQSKYEKAASVVCKQGMVPFPVNETTLTILKRAVGDVEAELDLIAAFENKASQTLAELKVSCGMPETDVVELANSLAGKGLLFNQPNTAGMMVYRLLPLMTVGLMEYTFMGPLQWNEKEKELAVLFQRLIDEVRDQVQENYDAFVPLFNMSPPVDRTVPARRTDDGKTIRVIPVNKNLDIAGEVVLPSQSVAEIIEKFDEIAVGHCFCRQRRALLGEPCATDAPLENCFTFGKSARHTASQGFARMITKEEAFRIMHEAEAAGLVHKAFHPNSNVAKPETSICNCCKDCCDTLRTWREGVFPLVNSTFHLSRIDRETCTGCGTCVDRCPTEAIRLDDAGKAVRDAAACFGCGVCARFCPEDAIALEEGLRKVFILPPRLRKSAG
ncbi:MAG: 4Fe-4S binding protein [Deltaproteobacteria bacterium]|nr:4Fe-4S binding protein [Deltaproteobacteria bacterium]